MPARSVTLRAPIRGTIDDVAVTEGDLVAVGHRLLRFEPTDAELAVEQAEAGLAAATAQLDLLQAGTREEQIAVVEAQLSAAQAAVTRTLAHRDEVTAGLHEADVIDAQAELLGAQSAYEDARTAHEDTMECYEFGGTEYCPTLGTYEEMARFQEQAAYAGTLAAQARLETAEARIRAQINASSASVRSELARRDAVEAELDRALAGPRAEEIAIGEAGVRNAESALAQAQEMLTQYLVDAPFKATVTDLQVHSGDTVAQGAPLATLATLDRMELKSTDLTELDVVAIEVGQPVVVIFDAMPDQQLSGTVIRIDPQGKMAFGDVLYTVTVELDSTPDWVRWGMKTEMQIGEVTS
ncbi:MAG: HlyD family secretion protein [Anaerolineae bacterium]